MNPDGAEWALQDKPRIIRSSTRPYPYDEEPQDGLNVEDIDGDGRILSMRLRDDNGNWKCHPEHPRLMVPRGPAEYGGEYYRILPEGSMRDFDGVQIKVNKDKQGLDLNRNFPAGWRQEAEQLGAGPYPTSEPEVRAVVDFITQHSNICGGLSFHTWSGVLLRPYGSQPDEEMPAEDLRVYQRQGEEGQKITGYPAISVYHEFRYHPKDTISGTFDWIYEHLGLYAWTVEIWCPMREAGIQDYQYIDWFRQHPVEDDVKLLQWSDQALEGKGYVDWYAYQHPQLGEVEIGGWDKMYAFRNPPPHLLEKEIAKFPDWVIWNAMLSPKLELLQAQAEKIGDGLYLIVAAVQNTGYLPSHVSQRALKAQQSRGIQAEITLPAGCELVSGQLRENGPELEGRAGKQSLISFWTDHHPTADRARMQWVLRASNIPAAVHLRFSHDKAGVVECTVNLPC
jgi:murein tripeptide amidase MpaA